MFAQTVSAQVSPTAATSLVPISQTQMIQTRTLEATLGPRLDLNGMRFGRLLVVCYADSMGGKARWLCRCDCGNEKVFVSGNLRSGSSTSCGCFQIERASDARMVHGHNMRGARTAEHKTWVRMLQRCENEKAADYQRYGGRGITVCKRWHIFENFFADMGVRPSADLSIDRKDNDGSYEPGNCRWATRSVQQSNKRPYHHRIKSTERKPD